MQKSAQRDTDVGALILPDVPYEEKAEFAEPCRQAGVTLISMVAPTSAGRVQKIAREAEGFVYCVSSLGVTGVRSNLGSNVADLVAQVREANPEIPCAIGFGISTPEQARSMAKAADGVIVGSAVVRLIAEHGTESLEPVCTYVREMANAAKESFNRE
ncbi:tryptophan synthase subunit alpha [Senegalimassilia faecalis]|uniref:tryptophan synthase subunit alpha n=1 Tax=Senegalimassilia faecalis TaxID=2509433 RepID=UPI003A968BEA